MSDGPRSSAPPPQQHAPGPTRLGRYHLLKRIGLGGMAEIWVARVAGIQGVQKICVVKRILPHLAESPEFVRMFMDEARIAATLTHPNLVQMYDVEEIDRIPLIAMEYLHGEDLRAIKKALRTQKRRMPLDHAINVAIGMSAGLHYAHEKVGFDGKPLNIVHRDISPHNVIVTYEGAVKILDFGIAKAANRMNETRDGALKGKIPYMSPEQCRSERLDRRTDIYSTGIILYEMSTGHRIFRRGATEFEIMRAIVEDQVTPPTRLVIDYPPELERIVLKCLAKNRAERYATARDLQIDLEAFAREHRLNTSALALASFVGELFGQRAEAWRDADASGDDFLAQIVERAPASELLADDWGADPELDPRASRNADEELFATKRSAPLGRDGATSATAAATPARLSPEPVAGGEVRALSVIKRRMGGILVVSLAGRMTEAFQGAALAREVSGRVLFDLAGVERVTSFGVREWLQMLNEASSRVSELYISRCSEPIVNQVSMIRRFAGDGRVASFYGPYRCESCGNTFTRLFDCEKDAAAIQAAEPPPSPCPRCESPGTFDDDAESYFAFAASYVGQPVPRDVRAVLDDLSKTDSGSSGEAIEKIIDDRATRVRVGCKLDNAVRWKRVLDGIEGELVLDLSGSAGVTPEGAKALEMALRGLGEEVRAIRIEGCPRALCEHIVAAKPPLRAALTSMLVDARCESCNAMRSTLLDLKEGIAAALEDRDPYVPCKRCNAALSFEHIRPLLRRMGGAPEPALDAAPAPARAPSDATPSPPSPSPASEASQESQPALEREARRGSQAPSSRSASRARSRAPVLLAGALGAALALGIGFAIRGAGTGPQVTPADPAIASATSSAGPASDAPPAWAERPFQIEGDQVFLVGRGTGANREAALSAAREDAIGELIQSLVRSLVGSPVHPLLRQRGVLEREKRPTPDVARLQAERYLQQVGAVATPERDEVRFHDQGGTVAAIARYRLPKESFDAAAKSFQRTARVLGLTVAPLFPLLEQGTRAPGDMLVVGVDEKGPAAGAGIRAGDIVVRINGQPVSGLDALESAVQRSSGIVEVEVDAGGRRQTARIARGK